jgi:hypothetical protein
MLKMDLNLSKYYNAETRNVLTSCNYRFLTPTQTKPKRRKSWSHPMLCTKGSWVMWGHVAHRAAYDASAMDTKEEMMNSATQKEKATPRRTRDGSSDPLDPTKAMFELDWPSHLPANDCVIANIFCLADHSLLPKEVNQIRATSCV